MSKKILLIGGGGHCKSIIDSLLQINSYEEIGIVDLDKNVGKKILGQSIIGTDENLEELHNMGFKDAFISLGSISPNEMREKLYNLLKLYNYCIPSIIDPSANISKGTIIGEGVYIGKNCIINASVTIDDCAIINTGSIIEHDCNIEGFSHISPGCVIGGGVNIGRNTHLGLNSSVKQGVKIGSNCLIGMGSVVIKDIPNSVLAFGVPCKEIKSI